jgi:hypothetical protein
VLELRPVENRLRLLILLPVVHPPGAHRPALVREFPPVKPRRVEDRLHLRRFRQAVLPRGPTLLLACPQRLLLPATRLGRRLPIQRPVRRRVLILGCPALVPARRRTTPRLRLHRLLPRVPTRQVLLLR